MSAVFSEASTSVLPLYHTRHDADHARIQDDSRNDTVDAEATAPLLRPDNEHEESVPRPSLYIPLTGYRLLTISLIFGIGTAKAILTAQGGSAAPTVLEWLAGVVCAIG